VIKINWRFLLTANVDLNIKAFLSSDLKLNKNACCGSNLVLPKQYTSHTCKLALSETKRNT